MNIFHLQNDNDIKLPYNCLPHSLSHHPSCSKARFKSQVSAEPPPSSNSYVVCTTLVSVVESFLMSMQDMPFIAPVPPPFKPSHLCSYSPHVTAPLYQ